MLTPHRSTSSVLNFQLLLFPFLDTRSELYAAIKCFFNQLVKKQIRLEKFVTYVESVHANVWFLEERITEAIT